MKQGLSKLAPDIARSVLKHYKIKIQVLKKQEFPGKYFQKNKLTE